MLPETLVTLIWTLDQSGVFSWPATRPQKRAAATRANTSKLRILWAMIFLRTVLRILSFDRTNGAASNAPTLVKARRKRRVAVTTARRAECVGTDTTGYFFQHLKTAA